MSDFTEHLEKDRRLVILRALTEEPDYALNESTIQFLLKQYGHGVGRDRVRLDISWLSEQSLVTVEDLAGRMMVATITQRGVDVASGNSSNAGVKRPAPGR